MVLTSHQPNFIPYLGFFYKAAMSDIIVLSDDVQFSKKGMHNWNYIYTQSGKKKLTLPVNAHHDSLLVDVQIDNAKYTVSKIVKTLEQEYGKAAHFNDCSDILEEMVRLSAEVVSMSEFNTGLIKHLFKKFEIKAKIFHGYSDLHLEGHKDERIFQMCKKLQADVYYSGKGAAVYHEEEEYKKRGICLVYSEYIPFEYQQVRKPFVQDLSVIDYIFNMGYSLPEWNRKNGG